MEAIAQFLTRRGVEREVMNRMSEEKIDCDAVVVMSDEELAKYIPAYGDRVVLMVFARCLTKTESNTDPRSGSSTGGIGVRVNAKRGPPSGNKNALRKLRIIDIGLLNWNSIGQTYKQVRSNNGGGTRMLALNRCCTMANVKYAAVGKLFPEGRCKIGNLEDFDIELRDFKGCTCMSITNLFLRHSVHHLTLNTSPCQKLCYSLHGCITLIVSVGLLK